MTSEADKPLNQSSKSELRRRYHKAIIEGGAKKHETQEQIANAVLSQFGADALGWFLVAFEGID